MKIGIIADIHANSLALEAVLDAAGKESIERLLIAGDFVGYYFHPDAIMEQLASWDMCAIRGNHENLLASAVSDPTSLEKTEGVYGSGLRIALKTLTPDQLQKLTTLPETMAIERGGCRILLCHGSPWDTDMYVYPDSSREIRRRVASVEADIVVMGHTHYPMLIEVENKILVNPGSVGQPRNRKPGASWALLDTDTQKVDFRHEMYDVDRVVEEARKRHPEIPYLADVLTRT